jgi:hypothetical protein
MRALARRVSAPIAICWLRLLALSTTACFLALLLLALLVIDRRLGRLLQFVKGFLVAAVGDHSHESNKDQY